MTRDAEAHRAANARYAAAHPDRIAAKSAAYREANRELLAAKSAEHYTTHKDEILARRWARRGNTGND